MATKSFVAGLQHSVLENLCSVNNRVLIGVGGITPWAIEATPPDVDPLTTVQTGVQLYIPAVVKAGRAVDPSYSGSGRVQLQPTRVYKTTTDPTVIRADNMGLLYVTGSLNHNNYPQAGYRSFGLYQNCLLGTGVNPGLTSYTPVQVVQARLFWLEHFQVVVVTPGVTEAITFLTRV